ncbi:hypothetical protein [Cetobacterium ceti]
MKKFIYFFIFFIISNNIFTAQTFNGVNQASIDIQVTVNVVPPQEQLQIVDENGNPKNSINFTHTIPSDFQGENTENTIFYIQRGDGNNSINLSSGIIDISLGESKTILSGPSKSIDSKIKVKDSRIQTTSDSTRIKNILTNTISKIPNEYLAPNEIYNTSNTMTVIWNKEGFN